MSRWLLLDLALIALLPAMILLRPETFRVADPFLWALHEDYILEFAPLLAQFRRMHPFQALHGSVSLLPLLGLPLAGLLWAALPDGRSRMAWRGLAIAGAAAGVIFTYAIVAGALQTLLPGTGTAAVHALALIVAVGAAALFALPLRQTSVLPPPARAALAIAAAPALLLLALAFQQVRWLGIGAALWLALLVTLAAVLRAHAFTWTRARSSIAAAALCLIMLPFPLHTMLVAWQRGYPVDLDLTQVVTRDVSRVLRARPNAESGGVLSGPTTSTWLAWFGGFRGLGTLYWENIDGLRGAAAIYAARSELEAKTLIEHYGITHIVIFSWDPFAAEYTHLARGERIVPGRRRQPPPLDAFVPRLLQLEETPHWLARVPYDMPNLPYLARSRAFIFEVRP